MGLATATKGLFDETRPSIADLRDFADSLKGQLKAIGFKEDHSSSDHYEVWDNQNGFTLYLHGPSDEHMKITLSNQHGSAQIGLKPWVAVERKTDYGSTLSSPERSGKGGDEQSFSWKDREKANGAIGAWVLNCASPATATEFRKQVASTPAAQPS